MSLGFCELPSKTFAPPLSEEPRPLVIDRLLKVVVVGGLALVAAQWVIMAFCGPIMHDSAYYASLARHVCWGQTQGSGFSTPYSPGVLYLLSLLGEAGLKNPVVLGAHYFLFTALDGYLVYRALRLLRHAPWLAAFWGLVYLVWVLASDGRNLRLEQYENTFLLLGFVALLQMPDWRGAVAAGLATGAALMMKQYAVLAVPGLVLMNVLASPPPGTAARGAPAARRALRGIAYLVCVPLPWLAYCLLAGAGPWESLAHLATWGKGARQYGTVGLAELASALADGQPRFTVIGPIVGASLLLLLLNRSKANLVIVALFVPTLLPLYVRTFAHYVQLAAPWGCMVLAQLAREVRQRFGDHAGLEQLLAVVLALPFGTMLARETGVGLFLLRDNPLRKQIQLADELRRRLPDTEGVVITGSGQFLYLFGDITPPDGDYEFVQDVETLPDRARRAKTVVVVPTMSLTLRPLQKADDATIVAWLLEHGWSEQDGLAWDGKDVGIFRPPELFHTEIARCKALR